MFRLAEDRRRDREGLPALRLVLTFSGRGHIERAVPKGGACDLAGGQSPRVSIRRAIVHVPEVFLFDEPLSHPDVELRVEIACPHNEIGAPFDLYRDLDNEFVVGFTGSPAMNFLDRVVRNGAVEGLALKQRVSLPLQMPAKGTEVLLGLRSEHSR